MRCIICQSSMSYFFSKSYSGSVFAEMMKSIGPVDYHRCDGCGFVASKTHADLKTETWDELNVRFHHHLETASEEATFNQPPYAEQALMLPMLGKHGLVNLGDILDYAAGYGTLGKLLHSYFGIQLKLFDAYVRDGERAYVEKHELRKYGTVINSAMFEHVLSRRDLDQVNDLVALDGSLVIHTVVVESVPKDPEWFYLRPPVHTAFHTNRSMQLLMDQWGYRSSIYCLKAKSWVFLRRDISEIQPIVAALNQELQSEWFFCKSGFMDYWKTT